MKPFLLARFTPSLMAPQDLEEIFVQREALASRLIEQIRESVTTPNKHHTLLVGPRGIGKTHLVTLVRNRVVSSQELRPLTIVAWLHEDEWGIASFLDLLLRIIRVLRESGEAGFDEGEVSRLVDLPPNRAESEAARLLLKTIGSRVLLLLIENLDDVFRGLSRRDQAAFRALLQDHGRVTILATTPGLFEGVSRRQFPFFGFFRIQHLEELGFEDAVMLLHKIALRRGQSELAGFILTPTGRARIRAVHHLAQGNPRVYVILSEFLTRQSLDELVEPVLRMLDDLTPYYQARLSWLSTQQRKLVDFLANRRVPAVVKEIAKQCFISPQTASSQLRKLAQWGYVRSEVNGRETYYELREPLMRFCLDLKRERKEPLRPLVEILRIWWTPDELELQLRNLQTELSPTSEYLLKALQVSRSTSDDPRAEACRTDFHRFVEADDNHKALAVAEEWVAVARDAESVFQLGFANLVLQKWDGLAKVLSTTEDLEETFDLMVLRVFLAWQNQDWAGVEVAVDRSVALADNDRHLASLIANLRLHRAAALFALRRYENCLEECERLLSAGSNPAVSTKASELKIRSLLSLERFREVEELLRDSDSPALGEAERHLLLGLARYRLDRPADALVSLELSLKLSTEPTADDVVAFLSASKIRAELGRWDDVLPGVRAAIGISPEQVQDWTPTLAHIAFLAVGSPKGTRAFLSDLNEVLIAAALPAIGFRQVMAEAAKRLTAVDGDFERKWREFCGELSDSPADEHALQWFDTAVEFVRTGDRGVLLRLPIEERAIVESLPIVANQLEFPGNPTAPESRE
jgi:tetratricopeptide (TPR) repeat protein